MQTGLYTYLSEGDATSPSITDAQILSELIGYWMDVKLEVPYSFFLANWDVDQTVVAYGEDAEGRAGHVSRLLVKPTTSNDIEELRGYVDVISNLVFLKDDEKEELLKFYQPNINK